MKFKNLSLVFVFVFIASLVVFSLCRQAEEPEDRPETYTYEWRIAPSIQARYPDLTFKPELEKKFGELMGNVRENHQMNAFGQNGQLLELHNAVLYEEEGRTHCGRGKIEKYFNDHEGRPFSIVDQSTVTVTCFDMERPGAVGDDAIDFVSVVRFNYIFDSGGPAQDPEGEVLYFHRKICTIDN